MKLKLQNAESVFEVAAPTEQRIVRSGGKFGWVVNISVKTPLTSDEVDMYFTAENIGELCFSVTLDNGEEVTYTLNGYQKINSAVIKRGADGSCTTDIQLLKEAAESES